VGRGAENARGAHHRSPIIGWSLARSPVEDETQSAARTAYGTQLVEYQNDHEHRVIAQPIAARFFCSIGERDVGADAPAGCRGGCRR